MRVCPTTYPKVQYLIIFFLEYQSSAAQWNTELPTFRRECQGRDGRKSANYVFLSCHTRIVPYAIMASSVMEII